MAEKTKRAVPAKVTTHGEKQAAVERPLRPGQCRAYMRRTLAKEYRGIVAGFVKNAKRGSCQHVKLATELLQAPATRSTRKPGTATHLLRELEREGL